VTGGFEDLGGGRIRWWYGEGDVRVEWTTWFGESVRSRLRKALTALRVLRFFGYEDS
jgi:hypothetical protein